MPSESILKVVKYNGNLLIKGSFGTKEQGLILSTAQTEILKNKKYYRSQNNVKFGCKIFRYIYGSIHEGRQKRQDSRL